MPKVSAKRQITLPVEQCRLAGILPGDEYESITIVKKWAGAAKGMLKDLPADRQVSEEASRQSSINA
ncbi:MAG: AbrB family transcriptional regulator [Thiohalomonadaceae bacterium]